ncbi:MAG: leucyl aminopeptidase family protein [Marinosulfonomonas sp.]|nr:leucyl aminopeptidase family protein [Marinosulfonomonas sp.]
MLDIFASRSDAAHIVHLVSSDQSTLDLEGLPAPAKAFAGVAGFVGEAGRILYIPADDGTLARVLYGIGDGGDPFVLAGLSSALVPGDYELAGLKDDDGTRAALAWAFGVYDFDVYKSSNSDTTAKKDGALPRLVLPQGVDGERVSIIARGASLARDLVNTPSSDMGPEELASAAEALAARCGAQLVVTVGDDLLNENHPMIHAVGRASDRLPRLIDMHWGEESAAKITLVGKGVCFDTGGLNLKPGGSMALMKKDMGGAAAVLGLAHMIMSLNLPLRLRVLVPAVENAISGAAFRPQDILTSRKGLTVEINNTDAEGRLVLADALALADEETPDCLISMATLTGAARVAVGPDLAPYFCDDTEMAAALEAGGNTARDPLWRLPFWDPYEAMIEPGIADLDNAPKGGFAGSITAALFLRRFVDQSPRYAHFDIYGWQPTAAPARPKGGVGQGTRAILAALPKMLGL